MKYSVIIPTYNRGYILRQVLVNALNALQGLSFEVLVIDDGSSDNTSEIVAEFDVIYHKCKVPSGGPAKPRNIGATMARGRYLCFLDSDDFWRVDKFSHIESIDVPFDFLYHGFDDLPSKTITYQNLLWRNTIITSSVIIKRTVFLSLGGFNTDSDLHSVEDYDFWLTVFKTKDLVKYNLSIPLGSYSISNDRISNNKQLRRKNCFALWRNNGKGLRVYDKLLFLGGLSRLFIKNVI